MQLPLVKVLLTGLQAIRKIPNLPKEALEPAVATGLEALGRGHDLDKLQQFLQILAPISGINDPDLDMSNLKVRVANSLGIDTLGLLKTPEQKQAELTQQALQQGASSAAQTAGANIGAAASDPEAVQQAAEQAGMTQ